MPKISVIIPVRNNQKGLEVCLDSLAKQSFELSDFEVIVVYNQKKFPETTLDFELNIRQFHEKHRKSSYAARNVAIKNAQAEIFAFTDSDCIPHHNWLKAGYDAIRQNKDVVAGKIQFLFSENPTNTELLDSHLHLKQEERVVEKQNAATANLFVNKEVFKETGLFPLVKSGGDTIFSIMANQAGHEIFYNESAIVYHPARKFRALMLKRFRIGTGLFLTTYYRKRGNLKKTFFSIIKATIKDLFPPRDIPFKKSFYCNLKTYILFWMCNIMTGIGRIYGCFVNLNKALNLKESAYKRK